MKRSCSRLCRSILVLASTAGLFAADGEQTRDVAKQGKWSTGVRVLPPAEPVVERREGPEPAPSPSTNPSLLPPQYLTTRYGEPDRQQSDGALRFLVSLRDRLLLVEARIMVDGRPFPSLREARIAQIQEALETPVTPASETPAADAPAGAAEDGDKDKKVVPDGTAESKTSDDAVQTADRPVAADAAVTARLRRYAGTAGRSPSREEIDWWLTNWSEGPVVVWLDENYQRVRAGAAPLLKLLDEDEDGVISGAELAAAEEMLWKCDVDQDEVVTLAEITSRSERQTVGPASVGTTPPIVPITHLVRPRILRRLCDAYPAAAARLDPDGDGKLSDEEWTHLHEQSPDLLVAVTFDTKSPSNSRLEVGAGDTFEVTAGDIREAAVTIQCGGTLLEVSAIQLPGERSTDQVSVGGVRDGFPLLPELDVNEDGRLTVREIRQVTERLTALDRDRDGRVGSSELLPTIRVCVGLGPVAHRPLVTVRSLRTPTITAEVAPPDWFVRMDRNRDGDLTEKEFLGGQEQFQRLDADGDKLISVPEAQRNDEANR